MPAPEKNPPRHKPTAITLSIAVTGAICRRRNGKIIVTASGGTAPYKYFLDAGDARDNGNFFFLPPNDFIIKVVDAASDTIIQIVTIPNTFERPRAEGDALNRPSSCNGRDGGLVIKGFGGTPPYLYSIDRANFQTSNIFTGLYAGIYPYFVKDANGCISGFENYKVVENPCIIAWAAGSGSGGCSPAGSELTVVFSGYGSPFFYSTDGVNFSPNNSNFYQVDSIYTIWIRNTVGDTIQYKYISARTCDPTILIHTAAQPAFCGQNGTITVVAEDGTAPYQYAIDGLSFQASNKFTGLAPGKYVATVKDSNSYESASIVIVGNKCIAINTITDSSTCGKSNGKIILKAGNGVKPYQYSIDGFNFLADSVFANLAAGKYFLYVKDAAGANVSDSVTVADKSSPTITSAVASPTACDNQTGSIQITTSGGVPPLIYAKDGNTFQSSAAFTNLAKGDYTITVKDGNGCINTAPATVSVVNSLSINAGNDTILCEGASTTLAAQSNGTQFSWFPLTGLGNPASISTTAKPLINTTYFVTASTGICSITDSVHITVKPAPMAMASQNSTICFGQDAVLQGSGGISYNWTPPNYLDNPTSANPKVIKPAASVTYILKVIGTNGCQSINDPSVAINVTPPPKLFAGNDTSVAIGQPLQLLAIDVNNSGFHQYKWRPFRGLSNAAIYNPIANLTTNAFYVVTASTVAGCAGTDSILIKVFKQPEIYVATAFAPGGINHLLHAIPVGIKTFQYFIIYNRWGKEVFRTTNANTGWDGQSQNSGAFVWIAAGVDYNGVAIIRKGTVVLLR